MVLFLFQMVFMDTALTIVTGSAAERWKYAAFIVSSFIMGAFTYPLFANWAWGGGWLANLGANFGLGKGYCDFAGSGVVHAVGGLTALAVSMIVGPRLGKYTRQGKPNAIIGHDIVLVLTGCFILAFGWFGFNPGSTLGASGNGSLRIGSIAVNTMLAGMTGGFGAMFYMWIRYGKPDASMSGNGLLAGLVAITAPSGFVNTVGASIIGLIAGVLVCLSVEFIDRVLKVDDPVGAISVHGTNGLWGVISVGLFADGKSNYGGAWNGVNGSVTGLFYGDASQLVAQLIGVVTLVGLRVQLQLRGQLDRGCPGRPASFREGRDGRARPAGNGTARLSRVRTEGPDGGGAVEAHHDGRTHPNRAQPPAPGAMARPSHGLARPAGGVYRHTREGLRRTAALRRPAHLSRHGLRHELPGVQVHGRARAGGASSSPTTSSPS